METLKRVALVCECGSRKFRVTTEQVVVDAYNLDGENAWAFNTECTVEKERYLEVVCVKCGKILVESFHEKPISKRAWDEFWNSHMVDFIMGFEHYVVDQELEDEDVDEKFLKGIGKGMWSLYKFIEAEMVREKTVKLRKRRYTLTEIGERKVKR